MAKVPKKRRRRQLSPSRRGPKKKPASPRKPSRRRVRKPKPGQVRVLQLPIDDIQPSPENDSVYRPVDFSDPNFLALVYSVGRKGIVEPILITQDNYVLSGHRRLAAAKLAGFRTVPCRYDPIRREGNIDAFVARLCECNLQREKSLDERLHEEIILNDSSEPYEALIEHRRQQSRIDIPTLEMGAVNPRCRISDAKRPMLEAIRKVLVDRAEFLPMSVRAIHYALLNDPPLRHAKKPGSRYSNTKQSYSDLVDLALRARLEGFISMDAIVDPTRPVTTWQVNRTPGDYLRAEVRDFLMGYSRDLLQSQPNHIEIVGEKNTIAPIIRPIAMEYCMPFTIGRGFASFSPRKMMADRFRSSGKQRLVVLMITDHDPDGHAIAESFARSMRDDCHVNQIEPIRIALTPDQVKKFDLPVGGQAKRTSANYRKFVAQFGTDVFELEALEPESLQQLLRNGIDSVLDVDRFNAELDTEKRDAAYLEGVRRRVNHLLKDIGRR
jgi:hypothetical protein